MFESFRTSSSRKIIWLTAIALAGFVGWANVAEIDQVSRAGGKVIPTGRVQIVQSTDGGVIDTILVKEGDRVRAGQLLVELDRVRTQALVEEAKAKVAFLKIVMARIQAELFEKHLTFPNDVTAYHSFMENQRQLFDIRTRSQTQDIQALDRMLKLAQEDLELNQALVKTADISRQDILRLERSVAEIEGQIVNRQNRYLQDLQAEYAKNQDNLIAAEQALTQRLLALADTELIAPTDGIVKNVRMTTVGGVLRPSDEVLQIVPTGEELIVEATVSPVDIAYIRLGQSASVKFDAYDSSIFGSADGRVIYASPDTLSEQSPSGEQVYYRVHIRVDTSTMRPRLGESITIQPGMTVTTEILTGQNTILRYLLKPIIRTVDHSFGER